MSKSEAFIQNEQAIIELTEVWNASRFADIGGVIPSKKGKNASWILDKVQMVRQNLITAKSAGLDFDLAEALALFSPIERLAVALVDESSFN